MTPFDCPRCGTTLTMSERQGIEIDYCPQCRGVWLDRGELDKILERACAAAPPPQADPHAAGWSQPPASGAQPPNPAWQPPGGRSGPPPSAGWTGGEGYHGTQYHHGKPRKSWLSELFD